MIGSLRGQVIEKTATSLLLEVGGVGYRLIVPPSLLLTLALNAPAFFYIHEHIREDSHDLFGFLQQEDLALFTQLLNVSGVGPKVAMTLLSVGSASVVRKAIMNGDLDLLTSVPGVGKKTAQKIVLEMKGQLVEIEMASSVDQEVIGGLQSLGYSAAIAREAVKSLPDTLVSTSDRLREALKHLAR
jgi:Holliday junction DNA helicase RuvA